MSSSQSQIKMNKPINSRKINLYWSSQNFNEAGVIDILASDKHIYAVCFQGELELVLKRLQRYFQVQVTKQSNHLIHETVRQLNEYFCAKRSQFDLPIELIGTDFQKKVWLALKKIPFGSTSTYKDIGHELQINNGFQAIGQANRNNPICIIVPCHRVISSSGQLSGYVGGSGLKSYLLRLEKC